MIVLDYLFARRLIEDILEVASGSLASFESISSVSLFFFSINSVEILNHIRLPVRKLGPRQLAHITLPIVKLSIKFSWVHKLEHLKWKKFLQIEHVIISLSSTKPSLHKNHFFDILLILISLLTSTRSYSWKAKLELSS